MPVASRRCLTRGTPLRPHVSDRAFRRLVAELAQVAPSDVQGVLDHLDPAHRDEVRALLAAYEGEPVEVSDIPPAEVAEPLGLSSWLEARARSAGADPTFAMTATASAALRDCIPALSDGSRPVSPSRPPTPRRTGGLDILLGRLRGRP